MIVDAVSGFMRALGPWHTRAPRRLKEWERAKRRRWARAYFVDDHSWAEDYPMLHGGHGDVWCGEDGDPSMMTTIDRCTASK